MEQYVQEHNAIVNKYKDKINKTYYIHDLPHCIEFELSEEAREMIKNCGIIALDKIFAEIGFSTIEFKNKHVLFDKRNFSIIEIFKKEHFIVEYGLYTHENENSKYKIYDKNTSAITHIFDCHFEVKDTDWCVSPDILQDYLTDLEKLELNLFESLKNTPNNYFKYIPNDITTIISNYVFKF